jgi:hypothetical protein
MLAACLIRACAQAEESSVASKRARSAKARQMFAGVPDHVDAANGLPTLHTAIFLLSIN